MAQTKVSVDVKDALSAVTQLTQGIEETSVRLNSANNALENFIKKFSSQKLSLNISGNYADIPSLLNTIQSQLDSIKNIKTNVNIGIDLDKNKLANLGSEIQSQLTTIAGKNSLSIGLNIDQNSISNFTSQMQSTIANLGKSITIKDVALSFDSKYIDDIKNQLTGINNLNINFDIAQKAYSDIETKMTAIFKNAFQNAIKANDGSSSTPPQTKEDLKRKKVENSSEYIKMMNRFLKLRQEEEPYRINNIAGSSYNRARGEKSGRPITESFRVNLARLNNKEREKGLGTNSLLDKIVKAQVGKIQTKSFDATIKKYALKSKNLEFTEGYKNFKKDYVDRYWKKEGKEYDKIKEKTLTELYQKLYTLRETKGMSDDYFVYSYGRDSQKAAKGVENLKKNYHKNKDAYDKEFESYGVDSKALYREAQLKIEDLILKERKSNATLLQEFEDKENPEIKDKKFNRLERRRLRKSLTENDLSKLVVGLSDDKEFLRKSTKAGGFRSNLVIAGGKMLGGIPKLAIGAGGLVLSTGLGLGKLAVKGAGGLIKGVGKGAGFLGASLTGGIGIFAKAIGEATQAVLNFAKSTIEAYGQIQSLKTQLGVIYGSQTEADAMFSKIGSYARKSPFGVETQTQQAILLKQSGVESANLMETIERLGDIASGNARKMQSVSETYARVMASTTVTAKDLRQLANAGVPVYAELTKQLSNRTGKRISQSDVRSMITKRQVSSEDFTEIIKNMTDKGGRFYGAVDIGAQTINARKQNLEDAKQLALASVGEWLTNFGKDASHDSLYSSGITWLEKIYDKVNDIATQKNLEKAEAVLKSEENIISALQKQIKDEKAKGDSADLNLLKSYEATLAKHEARWKQAQGTVYSVQNELYERGESEKNNIFAELNLSDEEVKRVATKFLTDAFNSKEMSKTYVNGDEIRATKEKYDEAVKILENHLQELKPQILELKNLTGLTISDVGDTALEAGEIVYNSVPELLDAAYNIAADLGGTALIQEIKNVQDSMGAMEATEASMNYIRDSAGRMVDLALKGGYKFETLQDVEKFLNKEIGYNEYFLKLPPEVQEQMREILNALSSIEQAEKYQKGNYKGYINATAGAYRSGGLAIVNTAINSPTGTQSHLSEYRQTYESGSSVYALQEKYKKAMIAATEKARLDYLDEQTSIKSNKGEFIGRTYARLTAEEFAEANKKGIINADSPLALNFESLTNNGNEITRDGRKTLEEYKKNLNDVYLTALNSDLNKSEIKTVDDFLKDLKGLISGIENLSTGRFEKGAKEDIETLSEIYGIKLPQLLDKAIEEARRIGKTDVASALSATSENLQTATVHKEWDVEDKKYANKRLNASAWAYIVGNAIGLSAEETQRSGGKKAMEAYANNFSQREMFSSLGKHLMTQGVELGKISEMLSKSYTGQIANGTKQINWNKAMSSIERDMSRRSIDTQEALISAYQQQVEKLNDLEMAAVATKDEWANFQGIADMLGNSFDLTATKMADGTYRFTEATIQAAEEMKKALNGKTLALEIDNTINKIIRDINSEATDNKLTTALLEGSFSGVGNVSTENVGEKRDQIKNLVDTLLSKDFNSFLSSLDNIEDDKNREMAKKLAIDYFGGEKQTRSEPTGRKIVGGYENKQMLIVGKDLNELQKEADSIIRKYSGPRFVQQQYREDVTPQSTQDFAKKEIETLLKSKGYTGTFNIQWDVAADGKLKQANSVSFENITKQKAVQIMKDEMRDVESYGDSKWEAAQSNNKSGNLPIEQFQQLIEILSYMGSGEFGSEIDNATDNLKKAAIRATDTKIFKQASEKTQEIFATTAIIGQNDNAPRVLQNNPYTTTNYAAKANKAISDVGAYEQQTYKPSFEFQKMIMRTLAPEVNEDYSLKSFLEQRKVAFDESIATPWGNIKNANSKVRQAEQNLDVANSDFIKAQEEYNNEFAQLESMLETKLSALLEKKNSGEMSEDEYETQVTEAGEYFQTGVNKLDTSLQGVALKLDEAIRALDESRKDRDKEVKDDAAAIGKEKDIEIANIRNYLSKASPSALSKYSGYEEANEKVAKYNEINGTNLNLNQALLQDQETLSEIFGTADFLAALEEIGVDLGELNNQANIGAAAAGEFVSAISDLAKGMGNALKTSALSTFTNLTKEAGKNFYEMSANSKTAAEAQEDMNKALAKEGASLLANMAQLEMETGLRLISAGAAKVATHDSSGYALIAAGVGLAALGGLGNVMSGYLDAMASDNDDNDNDDSLERLQKLKDNLAEMLKQARNDAEYYETELTSRKSFQTNEVASYVVPTKVNDMILTDNGVFSTSPEDTIMAMKHPEDLMSSGETKGSTKISFTIVNESGTPLEVTGSEEKEDENGGSNITIMVNGIVKESMMNGEYDNVFATMNERQKGISVSA